MRTSFTIVSFLIVVGVSGNAARADGCCGSCRGRGWFDQSTFVPNVTYYAPYPLWYPQYFGPPYSDYQVVQYVTPPAETAAIVKKRIMAINAANPALPPAAKESLSSPRLEKLPPPQK